MALGRRSLNGKGQTRARGACASLGPVRGGTLTSPRSARADSYPKLRPRSDARLSHDEDVRSSLPPGETDRGRRQTGRAREVAELYRVRDGDLCTMIVGARIPILKQWESELEAAIAEIGADSGGGRRLSEATTFLSFLRSESDRMLKRWPDYRRALR